MGVVDKIWTNLADVPTFGFQFLWRHSPFFTRAATTQVTIPGIGKVHLRASQSDASAIRQVFRYREYDTQQIQALDDRIFKRYYEILAVGYIPTIVDAGANIGAASLWFSSKYPKAHVVAVEPEPGNLSTLEKNVRHDPRITAIRAAIGSEPGFVSVEVEGHGWGATTARSSSGIPVVTMADAFKNVANGMPFIAKIDIEGFESDLFSRNLKWLDDVYVVFIEPHDWKFPGQKLSRPFQRAMAEHDFEVYIFSENLVYVRA